MRPQHVHVAPEAVGPPSRAARGVRPFELRPGEGVVRANRSKLTAEDPDMVGEVRIGDRVHGLRAWINSDGSRIRLRVVM
jgi:hypothetical protein